MFHHMGLHFLILFNFGKSPDSWRDDDDVSFWIKLTIALLISNNY